MKSYYRSLLRGAFLALAVLTCQLAALAAAESPADPAGRDLAEFDATFGQLRAVARSQGSPLEQAQAFEKLGLRLRELALGFLDKYPQDPRRWSVVYRLFPGFPRFTKDWGPLDEKGQPSDPVVDQAAAEAWATKVTMWRAQMAHAPDLPEEIRTKVAADKAESAAAEARRKAVLEQMRLKRVAPDFAMTDLEGRAVRLADFKGKVIILDFWATWCGPCKAAMPHTQGIAAKYRDQGVVVVASCTRDTRGNFEKWVKANAARYPDIHWAFDPLEKSDECASRKLYQVPAIPAQFVIDRNGQIVDMVIGFNAGDPQLERALMRAGVQIETTLPGS